MHTPAVWIRLSVSEAMTRTGRSRLVAPPEDTVFARISFLVGWQGTVMARRDPSQALAVALLVQILPESLNIIYTF